MRNVLFKKKSKHFLKKIWLCKISLLYSIYGFKEIKEKREMGKWGNGEIKINNKIIYVK
jgi:hypothetical protein